MGYSQHKYRIRIWMTMSITLPNIESPSKYRQTQHDQQKPSAKLS